MPGGDGVPKSFSDMNGGGDPSQYGTHVPFSTIPLQRGDVGCDINRGGVPGDETPLDGDPERVNIENTEQPSIWGLPAEVIDADEGLTGIAVEPLKNRVSRDPQTLFVMLFPHI